MKNQHMFFCHFAWFDFVLSWLGDKWRGGILNPLLLLLFFVSCKKDPSVFVEPSVMEFQKTYGGSGSEIVYAVLESSDKNYVIGGTSTSYGSGSEDFYLLKTDRNGNILWEKYFGGANIDILSDMMETEDGGFLLAGRSKSFVWGAGFQMYVVKTDADGNMQWQKHYGTNMNDCANSMVRSSDNTGYMLLGGTGGAIMFCGVEAWLLTISNSGDSLWSVPFGSADIDEGISIVSHPDGNYSLFCNTFGFGTQNGGWFVQKVNAQGDSLSAIIIDEPGTEDGKKMRLTKDGGLILCGLTTSSGDWKGDMYGVKLSMSGTVSWKKSWGGMGADGAQDVIQTRDGGFLFAGYSTSFTNEKSDMYLIKTDFFGNVQWEKIIGGLDEEQAFAVTETDDAYLIAGQKTVSAKQPDMFLVKFRK